MSSRLLLPVAAALALAGCNTANTHIGDEDAFFGESVKYDSAIQTINPAPVYAAEGAQPGAGGAVAAEAAKRYRTDKVKPVQRINSTAGSGGGNGGGSGSGGNGSGGGGGQP